MNNRIAVLVAVVLVLAVSVFLGRNPVPSTGQAGTTRARSVLPSPEVSSQMETFVTEPRLPGRFVSQYTRPLSASDHLLIQSELRGLEYVAKESPSAAKKFRWIQEHGIPAIMTVDGDSIVPVRMRDNVFPIWLIPFGQEQKVGQGTATMAAGYVARLHAVFFTTGQYSRAMRGILFAHELQHAEDNIIRGVQMKPNDNEGRDAEERSAYMFEHQVLMEYTHGRWAHAVQATLADRQAWKLQQGQPWQNFVIQGMPNDSIYMVNAFPGISQYDLGPLSIQLSIDANFHLIDSVAAGREDIREEGKKTFLRRYFAWLQDGKAVR